MSNPLVSTLRESLHAITKFPELSMSVPESHCECDGSLSTQKLEPCAIPAELYLWAYTSFKSLHVITKLPVLATPRDGSNWSTVPASILTLKFPPSGCPVELYL